MRVSKEDMKDTIARLVADALNDADPSGQRAANATLDHIGTLGSSYRDEILSAFIEAVTSQPLDPR